MLVRRQWCPIALVLFVTLFPRSARAQDECNGGIAAAVQPDGTETSAQANTSGNTLVFTVYNNGPCTDYTYLSAWGDGTVGDVTIDGASSFILGPWSSANVTVVFSIGLPPGGGVHLSASGYIQDEGYYNVTATGYYGVAVTPDNQPQTVTGGVTRADTFQVLNSGTWSDTYALTCSATGSETCGTVSPPSVTLDMGASTAVVVTFTPGTGGTGGTLMLTASSAATSDVGTFVITNAAAPPTVTPDGEPAQALENTDATQVFTVRNADAVSTTYDLTTTCTGTATNCSGPSSVTVASGVSSDVSVGFHVGAATTTGTVTLTASPTTNAAARDSGWVNVTALAAGKPRVVLRNYNSDNWDRSLCLTSGAGEAAAWQCGDLVVTHGLPGYGTMGRERSLTLLHNSTLATPRPTVAVSVSAPGGPDSVYVELRVGNPDTVRQAATYGGWSGGTRQIVLVYPDTAVATGVYPFTLLVQNRYGGTTYDSTVSGHLIIVNRHSSEFGSGWALMGVERLYLNQPVGASNGSILWVGGDGSAKVYGPAGPNTWVAPPGAYRDTLRYDPGTTTYTRTLRHRIQVTFDTVGRHVRTTNRTGQTSRFFWSTATGRLDSILVPPAGVAATTYSLAYDGNGRLDKITDPAGRVLDATVAANGWLMTLVDPDQRSTTFAYNGLGRMSARTNRQGFTTTYWYGWGTAMDSVRVPLDMMAAAGQHDTATTRFVWWAEHGIWKGPSGNTAVDTALAYAKVFGPRNVGDTAEFWIDRWGGPVKMRDPLGNQTSLLRGDAGHPALVTRTQYPDGRILGAVYNTRGNLAAITDSTYQGVQGTVATQPVTTSYVYGTSSVPDSPSEVDGPVDTTRVVYDTALGLPTLFTAQGGHKTAFQYITTGTYTGLLTSVADSAVAVVDTTAWTKSTVHLVTQFHYDAWGNDTATISPMGYMRWLVRDASRRVHSVYDPVGHRTDYGHDVMNRVDTVSIYESVGPLRTRYYYSVMGTLDSIVDPRGVKRSWQYDAAARQKSMIDDVGNIERRYLGRSGLVDSVATRNGDMIRYTYDAAGRQTHMIYPATNSNVVPGDTIVRTYDALGRLLTARNHFGKDSLAYNLEGTVRWQRQTYSMDFATRTWYDVGGRRVKFFNGTDTLYYRYGSDARLSTLMVSWSPTNGGFPADSFLFSWDGLGRRDRLVYATIRDTVIYGYDGDSRFRLLCSRHPGGTEALRDSLEQRVYYGSLSPDGLVHQMSVSAKGSGGTCSSGGSQITEGINNAEYDMRHELLSKNDSTESFAYDSSGNMIAWDPSGAATTNYTMMPRSNRLDRKQLVGGAYTEYQYDRSGNRIGEAPEFLGGNWGYYYNALGQMVGDSTLVYVGPGYVWRGKMNVCYYGALGRRVQTCEGMVYMGYDGDNVIRAAGGGGATLFWRFVQGPGIDNPLVGATSVGAGWERYYYLTDGQGRMLAFTDSSGLNRTVLPLYHTYGGNQAGAIEQAHTFTNSRQPSLDVPQLSFYRNRYYDQQTGRWTQEDPSELAGGVNLYAYVGNNPVAYTDPFGLCADGGEQGQSDSTKKNVAANYCSTRGTLQLKDSTGTVVFETPAGNNTVNPSGDPNQGESNGPAPTGTFPVQPVMPIPADATATLAAYGPAFFPVGACGTSPTCRGPQAGDIARRRGIGIHGGRTGPQYPTLGCIRVSNQAVLQLASRFNITSITIGCQ